MSERKPYKTDVSDEQWALVEPVIAAWKAAHPSVSGHQGRYAMREIVNALLYQGRAGCQWDLLPHDFPPPGAVKYHFYTWRDDGTDQTIHDLLRWQVREKARRKADPSLVVLDTQSVHAAARVPAQSTGRDAAKKVPAASAAWLLTWKSRHECSPAFQLAVDDVLSVGRRGPDRRTKPRPGTPFREEHVPAFLRDEWADRHLFAFPGIPLWQLRRGAAVRLVKRARGGSIVDAARFLGVLPGTEARFDGILTHRLKGRGLTFAFEAALDALEREELSHQPTDYEYRRQVLKDWAIPPETWQTEIVCPGLTQGCRFTADDRKCLAVSAYVWARVTHGEHLFAPTPAEIQGDDTRQTIWRRDLSTVFSLLKRARNPRYLMLKELLDAYADRLAESLDSQCSTRQAQRSLAK